MTSINVTRRDNGAYQDLLDWKRRSERLVRLSGARYTIIRPSWFNPGAGAQLVIEQGDTGSGAVSREQVGEVLIRSLLTDAAVGKTFELYATAGGATTDWKGLFDTAISDTAGALDGAKDPDNLPLEKEPAPRPRGRSSGPRLITPTGTILMTKNHRRKECLPSTPTPLRPLPEPSS
jgi:uncharacterized protein YbjT (DUF2867 family)